MRPLVVLLLVLLGAAPHALAAAAATPDASARPETAEEIRRCMVANAPDVDHVQSVEFVSTDRLGGERTGRAQVYTRRDGEGKRRILVRFAEPEELVGSAFLVVERASGNELLVRSPDLPAVKRVAGRELLGSVAGTDFSYEDVQQIRNLPRPGAVQRLPDTEVDGRGVWVLETRPADGEISAYESIRSFVDRETCLLARAEFYESGGKLRKLLESKPERFRRIESVWVANEAVMRDVRDGTETRVVIESFEVDAEVPAELFKLEGGSAN